MKALIFDLDGTLWDSTEGVVEAWNSVLELEGYGAGWLTVEKLHGVMGKTIPQIGAEFFPELSEENQLEIVKRCCDLEQKVLRTRGSQLYDNLERTLNELSQHYQMYIVSNCQEGYIETFLHYHRLEAYFEDFESHGRTKLSKGENIRLVMMRNQIEEAVYIGDTRGDMEAAEQAGIPFIFAAYGFGKIGEGETPWAVQKTNELYEVVNNIL